MSQKRGLEEESASEEHMGVKRVCQEPENGRPGDWLCPSCSHHNWSFRDTCQKCFTNKEGFKTAEVKTTGKPGDWNCPGCGHLNYAFRHACQRCYVEKPFSAGDGAPAATNGRPGDWTCPTCGDLVYASRNACRKCNTPKMMGMPPGGYGMDPMGAMGAMGAMVGMPGMGPMGGQAPPKEARSGDWTCPQCFDINYASRTVCRMCGTAKTATDPSQSYGSQPPQSGYGPQASQGWVSSTPQPYADQAAQTAQMYGYDMSQVAAMPQGYAEMYGFTMGVNSAGGPGGGGGASRRAGDWDCPNCGDVVYGTRSECRKCKTAKPDHLGPTTSNPNFSKISNRGLGPSRRAGDWDCPACGDVQYASRTECRKCRTAKPEI